MRCLIAVLAIAALVSWGHAGPHTMTQKETMDLFFRSMDAREQFGDAVKAMGLRLDQGMDTVKSVLTPPWANRHVMKTVQGHIEDGKDELIEKLRRILETVAEPLKIENVNLNISKPLVQSVGYIKDVTISKLSTFAIDDLDVDLFSVSGHVVVSFDKLDTHGMYNIDATASGQIRVFGDGTFDVRVYQPVLDVDIRLGYNEEHFRIEDLQIFVKMAKLKVIMTNLLGGGEVGDLMCGIISDVGPSFLEEYSREINNLLSSEIKSTANALLARLDINTVIDWISGGSNN